MPLQFEEMADGKTIEAHMSGTLTARDYEQFTPEVEKLIQQRGKVRMLSDMHDFHGWDMRGLWEEFKLDVRHSHDLERLAVVGEKKWQMWMTRMCRPFTNARIRFFHQNEMDQARAWIHQDN